MRGLATFIVSPIVVMPSASRSGQAPSSSDNGGDEARRRAQPDVELSVWITQLLLDASRRWLAHDPPRVKEALQTLSLLEDRLIGLQAFIVSRSAGVTHPII